MKTARSNLEMIRHVAVRLVPLRERMAFLGGAATALLVTDPAAPDVRITTDVDVIVEAVSLGDYYNFSNTLHELGFSTDTREGAPVCRWLVDGIAVDIMPTEEGILGFGNPWYREALNHAVILSVDGMPVRVVNSLYFLATKITAFRSRGHGDFLASHDIEDIITLLDGRPEVVSEHAAADRAVGQFISRAFAEFLGNRVFLDALPGHLPPDPASQQRIHLLMSRIQSIVQRVSP